MRRLAYLFARKKKKQQPAMFNGMRVLTEQDIQKIRKRAEKILDHIGSWKPK